MGPRNGSPTRIFGVGSCIPMIEKGSTASGPRARSRRRLFLRLGVLPQAPDKNFMGEIVESGSESPALMQHPGDVFQRPT